jgi:4-hydroxy-tetrahydrodipicolinate reductase
VSIIIIGEIKVPVRVVIHGAFGRMGREAIHAFCSDKDIKLVGSVSRSAITNTLKLQNGHGSIPLSNNLASILDDTKPDVLVDFSVSDAVKALSEITLRRRIHLVIGTTGITPETLLVINQLALDNNVGVVVASNFALGAVLMIHLAEKAAPFFDDVEIVELHREKKLDSPSGTAIATKNAINKTEEHGTERETYIHSIRLPGLLAHQEVIFGSTGETLHIRHDTVNTECYMPGLLLAVKEVARHTGLVYGLDRLLNL